MDTIDKTFEKYKEQIKSEKEKINSIEKELSTNPLSAFSCSIKGKEFSNEKIYNIENVLKRELIQHLDSPTFFKQPAYYSYITDNLAYQENKIVYVIDDDNEISKLLIYFDKDEEFYIAKLHIHNFTTIIDESIIALHKTIKRFFTFDKESERYSIYKRRKF